MQSEQFWKKLDRITSKKQTIINTTEFLKVLAEGYSQKLDILILGVENKENGDFVNQACLKNNGKKSMLYFTDKRHVQFYKGKPPVGSMYFPKCLSVCICDVINNALEQEEVTALVFNPDSKNMYIIPKFMLELHLLNMKNFLRKEYDK